MHKNKQPIIFTTPEFKEQGQQFAKLSGAEFGNSGLEYGRFGDGTPQVRFTDISHQVRDRIIFWLGDISNDAEIFRQFSALCSLPPNGANSLDMCFPYFPYGTMERKVHEGDVVTAKTAMRLIGAIPGCREAKNRVSIFDIHDPREEFYSNDNLFFRMVSWMSERAKELPEDTVIVFPDLGAKKRFGNLFGNRRKIVFEKIRNPLNPTAEEKELKIIEGAEFVKDGNLCVIDDLVMTGGTLKCTANILRDKGAGKISALFTHPVFPGDTFDTFIEKFDEVITSDTVPLQAEKLEKNPKVTIHSIVPQLSEMIQNI